MRSETDNKTKKTKSYLSLFFAEANDSARKYRGWYSVIGYFVTEVTAGSNGSTSGYK